MKVFLESVSSRYANSRKLLDESEVFHYMEVYEIINEKTNSMPFPSSPYLCIGLKTYYHEYS